MDKPAGRLETIDFAKTQYAAAADVYGRVFAAALGRWSSNEAKVIARDAVDEFNCLMNRHYGAQSL